MKNFAGSLKFRFCFLLLIFSAAEVDAKVPTKPKQDELATLVIKNARIWTGADDGKNGETRILAINGDQIVRVVSEAEFGSDKFRTKNVIDAGGRRIIPGITDSHTHIIGGGFQLARLDLRATKSKEEFIAAVAAEAKTKKKGEWIQGGRFSVESWAKPESPRAEWLDPVTGETPVFLSRMDGHQALVNSATLKLAGIDEKGPPDPIGGEIERDPATRKPTGILKESAKDLVARHIPKPTDEQRMEALTRAMKHANSLGVTSVHDMSDVGDIPVFRKAAEGNELTVRITSYIQAGTGGGDEEGHDHSHGGADQSSQWHTMMEDVANWKKFPHPMFRVAGYKAYMDGSLGSRTAYMREPYVDATSDMHYPRGQLTAFASSPDFRSDIVAAIHKDMQIAIHAIGDEANHLLLDAYDYANQQLPRSGPPRWQRIEHAQHLHLEEIPRFTKSGVVASMQPYHKADDGRYAEKALGKERLKGSYAFRPLLDAKALLIFGSDWPVVTLNPFAGVDSAVNARTLTGEVWLPEHSISVEEAMRAYCVSPNIAINRSLELGTLEAGKLADFVILDQDPFTIPREDVGKVTAWKTFVGGKKVFSRE